MSVTLLYFLLSYGPRVHGKGSRRNYNTILVCREEFPIHPLAISLGGGRESR